MRVDYHPAVQRDGGRILRHYDRISSQLGDAFWEELMAMIEVAWTTPERFHPVDRGRRRANLKRFPYHFLYRITADGIQVTAVRHRERNPNYGTRHTGERTCRRSWMVWPERQAVMITIWPPKLSYLEPGKASAKSESRAK